MEDDAYVPLRLGEQLDIAFEQDEITIDEEMPFCQAQNEVEATNPEAIFSAQASSGGRFLRHPQARMRR